MEGIQKNSAESVEKIKDWRELIKESPAKAKELISGITGFDSMEHSGKITALTELVDTLLEDNNNRYIAGEIARYGEKLQAIEDHNHRMAKIGVTI